MDKRTLQEQTALLLASSAEHVACVRSLLEAGADPDICGKNKDTPLYIGEANSQTCVYTHGHTYMNT